MLVVCIRTLIAYFLIIAMIRLMGKRQLGELQPSELVTTILISNLASLPIEDEALPLITSLLPILIIVSLEILLSIVEIKSQKIATLVAGSPKVVIKDGVIDQKALVDLRFGIEDLLEALRNKDVFDYREVSYGVIETNGNINLYKKFTNQNLTNGTFELVNEKVDRPPISLVIDGVIQDEGIMFSGITREEIEQKLSEQELLLSDIYIMQICNDGKFIVVRKDY